MTDIYREAEISRGTFYAHFSNIAEALDTLLDDVLAGMDYLWECLSATQLDVKCSHHICRFVLENTELRCILFDDSLGHIVVKRLASRRARKKDDLPLYPGRMELLPQRRCNNDVFIHASPPRFSMCTFKNENAPVSQSCDAGAFGVALA